MNLRSELYFLLQALLKKRNDELQQMLDYAATRPTKGIAFAKTPRMRVDLREEQILQNPTAYTSDHPEEMGTVILEDEEGELRAQTSNLKAIMNLNANSHGPSLSKISKIEW